MTEGKCAIWGTDAKAKDIHDPSGVWCDSARAGGKYKLSAYALHMLSECGNELRAKYTTWLVDQRRSGIITPEIWSEDLTERVAKSKLLSTSKRLERFFLYCLDFKKRLGDKAFYSYALRSLGALEITSEDMTLMAYCEFLDEAELNAFSRFLHSSGYLDDNELTYKAFERIDELSNNNANSNQAFVAMWFDRKMDDVYVNGIQPAIEGENFKPVRIDKEHHTKNIIDFMIGEIKRSKFIVADFTSMILKDGHDRDRQVDIGGVYFEAGYALGLNIPVIWTCHKNHSGSIHFDLKQFNTIFYTDPDDLKLQLSTRIRAMFVT